MMRPILFNTEMVEVILEGKKTITRRKVKTAVIEDYLSDGQLNDKEVLAHAPYNIGDILYIRETWRINDNSEQEEYSYRAGSNYLESVKWKPSIHMPKVAARLFLKIIDIKIEKIQEITNEGAIAEGVSGANGTLKPVNISPRDKFKDIWQDIYCDWEENPWVWVIEFKLVEKGEYKDE